MKFARLFLTCFILCVIFLTSAVCAADLNGTDNADAISLEANDTLEANSLEVYVDCNAGSDSNSGESQNAAVETFQKALEISGDDASIHLSNGVYSGSKNTQLTIAKSLTVIGSSDTTFDGEGMNYLFKILDNSRVTFKNIKFINAFKQASINNQASMYGGALEINNANVLIENCSFINNYIAYDSSINKYNYGGAISNFGDLTIVDSYFEHNHVASTSGLFGYGGSIYNNGKLTINSTTFNNSTTDTFAYGGAIYNDGDLIMDRSVIANLYSMQQSKGSAVFNAGNFTLTNSVIENNTISLANFNYIYGAIYNYGNFIGYGNIFRNNSGVYEAPNPEYRGSPTIFNVGLINMTYSVFEGNAPFNGISCDVYVNGGKVVSLEDNWWSTNEDPYTKNRINIADNVNSWFIFNLDPEYTALNIGESVDLNAYWSLSSTLNPKLNLFPVLDVNFMASNHGITKKLVDGQCTFTFDYSQKRGLYPVVASMGEYSNEVLVDVGKIVSDLKITITDNVTYTDDIILTVDVSARDGNVPAGNVSVIVDRTIYIIYLENGKGQLNLSNMDPNKYNFKIVYEGSENYFKAFEYANVSVNKAPTDLKVYFPDIKVDQKGSVTVSLNPKGVQGQAYLYINGIRKKVLYLYNGNTTVAISNFDAGEYNVTVEFWGTKYYSPSTASTTFKVTKYDVDLNLGVSDISLGETQIISIKLNPGDLRGEAILNINGVDTVIFLDSEVTNVTIANMSYGAYDVWVYFPENQKYYSCNVSGSFNVFRNFTSLDVDIVEDEFKGTFTVKTNCTDCTGNIGVYVNYRLYYAQLANGAAKINVTFDKGTNYVFVFYDGDKYYEPSNWNTTLGVAEEFILIGENSTSFEHNDFSYVIHLIEYNGIPMPNRIVNVLFNGTNHTITTNDDGIAVLPLNLAKGNYGISATYKNQTVNNTLTVKEIKFNLNVSDGVYHENLKVLVEFEGNLTGKVNLYIEGILNESVDITGSKAEYGISNLNAGSYNLTACYVNGNFTSSNVTTGFNVSKANPAIDAQINDIVYGENGTIRVTLLDDATGSVVFIVDGKNQTVNLTNASASIDLIGMSKDTHNVTVIYEGDSNYNSARLNSTFNVKDAYTDIVLSVGDVCYGENITVKAILNETATGNVTFTVDGRSKSVEISHGQANWTFSGINAGKYKITASYLGDRTFISSKNSTTFNVMKANSTLQLFVNEVYLGENILIYAILSENATGSVSFSITDYYSPRNKPISNSVAVWYISPLDTGKYTILARYAGDNNYCASNASYLLDITQRKSRLSVNIADAGLNDRVTARVTLTTGDGEAITGKVALIIGTRTYTINVNKGEGNLVIGRLPEANYQYSASYEGNENYSKASVSGQFRVVDGLLNLTLTARSVSCYYGANKNFVVSVTDDNNNPISNLNIAVKIAGITYNLITSGDGKVSVPIKLDVGRYDVDVMFYENLRYHAASTTSSIEVLSTVEGIDVVSIYGSTAQYFAIFTDSNGKALANTEVKVSIGGETHTVKTLLNGIIKINIKYSPGRYTLTALNPVTGQRASNSIFIFLKLMENKDITAYYGSTQVYKVRAYDDNGNPVGAGKVVTFKVNGKTYNIKTDKKGYAACKVKLKPKTYTITATFGGYKVSNKIKVKKVLTAKSISLKKGKPIKFKAKLVNKNGKALKGKKITFKFKGKTYKVKTNKKGIATLKLKLKLKVGKHKIKVKYGKSSIKRTIKIKK